MKRYIVLSIVVVLAVMLFVWGANQQSVLVNTNMHEIDQSAYMDYARNMALTKFQFVGGRNRMPLYPVLMSFFYEDELSDDAFFERGKKVGILIGLISSIVTFLLFNQIAHTIDALTGTLVAMFTIFVYKSPYFQAEVIFYVISLVLFYLLVSLVNKPKITTAALAGFVGGIGHLTKASVLPAVLLASLLVIIRSIFNHRQGARHQEISTGASEHSHSAPLNLLSVVILLVSFLLIIFPYIRTSKIRFGQYFYNVNSTFYMWYDSWEEAKLGTKAHGDRQGWPVMPPEEIPSFHKYVQEHTLNDIVLRFKSGFIEMKNRVSQSYGYAEFVLVYAIALSLLFIQNKTSALSIFRSKAHPCVLLFVFGYFLGYLVLYAWYSPIAAGNRFVLSLFLPAMLLLIWGLSYAKKHQMQFSIFGRKVSASLINVVILIYLCAYVITVFPTRISTMFGGS